MIQRVLETSLYAQDLDAAERFYGEILGLSFVKREGRRHLFYRCGEGMLLIFNPDETERSTDIPPHGARGPGHVAFAVLPEALEAWKTRLEAAGVPIEADVRWPNGARSLYLRDPAGNSVELTTPSLWGFSH